MPTLRNTTAACVVGGITLIAGLSAPALFPDQPVQAASPPQSALDAATQLSTAFEYAAETISPSVVSIRSSREVQQPQMNVPREFFNSPFGDRFSEDFFGRLRPDADRAPRLQRGEGSGVIISQDGHILTNSHVVHEADEVIVVLADGRELGAEVIGTDEQTDLAVIKIRAGAYTPATLGYSADLRVGQWVVAAGNPFALSSTITSGIISATGRSRMGITDYEDFIQTDAAINPGNSGGPLVNLHGEVIGINTAIFTRGGGNNGIGFAIPIDMARNVMNELIDTGEVVRGYLGVVIQDLDENMAASFGYDSTKGALVSEVTGDGPAGEAGIRAGDIITRIDQANVDTSTELRMLIADTDPGEDVQVTLFRDGTMKTINITIGERSATPMTVSASAEGDTVDLGMTIQTLRPDTARQLGLDESTGGVVVTAVEPIGPAARAGLQRGDVIRRVQGAKIGTAAAFRDELRKHDLKEGVRIVVQTRGVNRFAFLRIQ